MQVDTQRITKKDVVFDNVKILNGNQIPLTNTLSDKLPLRGSLIALKSGNIHDLYYADGLQWVPVTDGGSAGEQPLNDVLAVGNVTGGNDIEITNGDRIVSETDGRILIESSGPASSIVLNSGGQVQLFAFEAEPDAIRLFSVNGGVTVDSDTVFNLVAGEQIFLQANTTDADAVRIFAPSGGIDIDAGDGGIDIDSAGPINLTSTDPIANAIIIEAGVGGVNVASAQQLNLISTQTEPDAVRIQALNAGGGIDISSEGIIEITSTNINLITASGSGSILLDASSGDGNVNVTPGTEINMLGAADFITHSGSLSVTQNVLDPTATVDINSRTGIITMASTTAIGPGVTGKFMVNNTTVDVNDLIFVTPRNNTSPNVIFGVNDVAENSFEITFTNPTTASAVVGTPVVQFMVVKT